MKKLPIGIVISILLVFSLIYIRNNNGDRPVDGGLHQIGELNDGFQSRRLYKSGKAAEDSYYKAFEVAKISGVSQVDIEAPDIWESIGPVNQGGRTIALEIDPNDPNVVYAGAASGGLWKLTSTGTGRYDYSWERIETGFPVLGVGAISLDPRDSDVIYIGTGEAHMHRDYNIALGRYMYTFGIGILKSTDGGESWSKSLDWSYNQSRGVMDLEHDPDNPDILFAGTTEGIYRTIDSGGTWQQVLDVIMANDIVINPDDPDIVFAACGNIGSPGTGIYRTIDGGDTWERLSNGLPVSWNGKSRLDIYGLDSSVIFADIYNMTACVGLYRSSDNGSSWTLISDEGMGDATGLYAHYIRVNPSDEQKIFKAEQIYGYSEDGGSTYIIKDDIYGWLEDSTIMHVDHHAFVNHPDDPDMFYAGNDGGVFRTYDNGETFQNLNNGYVTAQFYTGFTSSKTDPDHAIGGTQDNGTFMYTGSPKWRITVLGSDGGTTAIDENDEDIVYALRPRLHIFRSTDRGDNFHFIGPVDWYDGYFNNANARLPHEDEKTKFPHPFELLPSKLMYAATNYVYKSTNGGDTWECLNYGSRVSTESIVSMTVSRINTNYIYAATYPNSVTGNRARVLRSKNGGDTWEIITHDLPDRYLHVYVSPHNENVVYVTTYGFGTSHLFRSMDAGDTWEDIGAGLPDIPTITVEIDPLYYHHIYVGNDLGVWISVDDGETWNSFNMGFTDAVIVTDLSISESNRRIRATTHGNGAYERAMLPETEMTYTTAPVEFELIKNYPNPFNSSTLIEFSLEENARASIRIYSILGQLVKTFDNKGFVRGVNRVGWNGTTDNGSHVSSGVYLCRLTVNGRTQTRRMTIIN
ncbi:MAG: T9SS type A sorting domain-containing protein [bacterium]|nr:T9SS type A sorting domain-containing protein [bacterium]